MFILIALFLIIVWLMLTPGSLMEIWGASTLGTGVKFIWTGAVIFFPILGSVIWILD
ncbi:MAG: hypothetical protein AAF696_26545 [Bacteroidota bacterium]